MKQPQTYVGSTIFVEWMDFFLVCNDSLLVNACALYLEYIVYGNQE
jgi:hypothetical protein